MRISIFAKAIASRLRPKPVALKNPLFLACPPLLARQTPSIEIIIPTRDKQELLKACLDSIALKTNYDNLTITVIDNDSSQPKTLDYLNNIKNDDVSILRYRGRFNFSAMCNLAARVSTADYLLFLNNDVTVNEGWLSSMIAHTISQKALIVGKRLLYPDGLVQHAGVSLGLNGVVSHPFSKMPDGKESESARCYNVSAVTFACVLIDRKLFSELGGLDESFKVGLNDIDFCLRASARGVQTVICGSSPVVHHESATRANPMSARGFMRAAMETIRFVTKWQKTLLDDDFFSYK